MSTLEELAQGHLLSVFFYCMMTSYTQTPLMTDFTIAELDEIWFLVKTWKLEGKVQNQEQKDLHNSIAQKVNAITAEILDNS